MQSESGVVFVFETDGYLHVHRSLEEAANHYEVNDLDEMTFIGADGTMIEATAIGPALQLTRTGEDRLGDLLAQLRVCAARRGITIDRHQQDDPLAYAKAMRDSGWHRRRRV